jgi:hypothetical protein
MRPMKIVLRLLCTGAMAYGVVLGLAFYLDRHPATMDGVGGHNIVIPAMVVAVVTFYSVLGFLPPFRNDRTASHGHSDGPK